MRVKLPPRFVGDSFAIPIRLKTTDGTPVDLTGTDVRFTLTDWGGVSFTLEDEEVELVRDDLEGMLAVNIHYTAMEQFRPGDVFFDIELTFPDDFRKTLFLGQTKLGEDLTK